MRWICIDGTHINAHRIDTFFWKDGKLVVCFTGNPEPMDWDDPARELYLQVCHQLGARPVEEDGDGKN